MDVPLSTIAFVGAMVVAFLAWRFRPHPALVNPPPEEISLAQVAARIDAFLEQQLDPGSFLVFVTDQSGSDGGAGFAQVSVESDGAGVDHVFTCDVNRHLEEPFRALAHRSDLSVLERLENEVSYLRVLPHSPGEFCCSVLIEVFGQASGSTLGVIEHAA